jgi:membrane-associated phospholipid phosphatase
MVMKRALAVAIAVIGLISQATAQVPAEPPQPTSQPPASGNSSTSGRSVSWPQLIPNIAEDQKDIWTFPAHLTHDHYWIPFLGVAAVTAGLVAADPWTEKPFRNTTAFNGFNSAFSSTNTSLGMVAFPASLYLVGLFRKDSYAQNTALLAGEAVVDSEILVTAFKTVGRRVRPREIAPSGNLADTWFESPGGLGLGHGGFPSGHAIAAFAIATVVARRYGKRHRWVPLAAYGLAAAIGFSRVTTLAHFPSDVFLGAALGYSVSRFAVLH